MNKTYVKARDTLIPKAVAYANETVGERCGERDFYEWADEWNYHFHTKMNDLAAEIGLVKPQIKRPFFRHNEGLGTEESLY